MFCVSVRVLSVFSREQGLNNGDNNFDALEADAGLLRRITTETPNTMSRSETPTSNRGTPRSVDGSRSAGAASGLSFGGSTSSSFVNSLGAEGRGEGGPKRRPSMRLQNDA